MREKHLLLTVVSLLSRISHLPPPPEGPGCWAGPVVAAQFGVVQQVPHEPDLGHTEAVNNHEFPVETRVECLKVGRCRRSGNAKSPKALVAKRFNANQLEAHSQKDVIDGEQLHLEAKK